MVHASFFWGKIMKTRMNWLFNIMRSYLFCCVGDCRRVCSEEVFDTYYFQLQVLCAGTMLASMAAAQITPFDTVCLRRVELYLE